MPATPARILSAVATAALVIAPLATASPAGAAAASRRHTVAMELAAPIGWVIQAHSQQYKLDGRSNRSLRAAMEVAKDFNHEAGLDLLKLSGLVDRNRDGLDDDAKVTVRAFNNVAVLALHKNGAVSVFDGGFVFQNRRSVLTESARSFDWVLRAAAAAEGKDSWSMSLIKNVKAEMPAGVRVVSDYDGNHDGYDDDGRLTLMANGKAVTLTIGNTGRAVGKITYGPTWKTKAPKRTHRPSAPPS